MACVLRHPGRSRRARSQAVAQYARLRDEQLRQQGANHLSFLAHELRDPPNSAQLALALLCRQAEVGQSSAGQVLNRSLDRLRDLIDAPLTSGLLAGGFTLDRMTLSLTELLAEAMAESDAYARTKEIRLILDAEEGLTVEGEFGSRRDARCNAQSNETREGLCCIQNSKLFRDAEPASTACCTATVAGQSCWMRSGMNGRVQPGSLLRPRLG